MEKKMDIESELVRVIAVNNSGVSFLLKYTNTEDREESAIIRVPNGPGKPVELTEEQQKEAWPTHMSRAPPILEEDIKVEEPINGKAARTRGRIQRAIEERFGQGKIRFEPCSGWEERTVR